MVQRILVEVRGLMKVLWVMNDGTPIMAHTTLARGGGGGWYHRC